MSAGAAGTSLPSPTLLPAGLILGRDNNDRPHAAWFLPGQLEAAESAAQLMDLHFVAVGDNQELAAIATKLPKGKLFDSGKAFVPFIAGAAYDQLLPHAPAAAADHKTPKPKPAKQTAAAVEDDPTKPPVAPKGIDHPKDWQSIKLGSTVLASETREDGWFEAIVTEVVSDDVFGLKWADYPDYDPFLRHRQRLALKFPHAK